MRNIWKFIKYAVASSSLIWVLNICRNSIGFYADIQSIGWLHCFESSPLVEFTLKTDNGVLLKNQTATVIVEDQRIGQYTSDSIGIIYVPIEIKKEYESRSKLNFKLEIVDLEGSTKKIGISLNKNSLIIKKKITRDAIFSN